MMWGIGFRKDLCYGFNSNLSHQWMDIRTFKKVIKTN